jgi:Domain of unknown function (DUF4291)
MPLVTELYHSQLDRLPKSGNHIVAQYDAQSIVVYQAYRPAIGRFAAEHGYFGGEFKFERMSWIKPNFLWMMYRSGWGTKEGQEVTLVIWLGRAAFEEILAAAVHSKFLPEIYASESEWKTAVRRSPVRLQWDPDVTHRELDYRVGRFSWGYAVKSWLLMPKIGSSALKIYLILSANNAKISRLAV